MCNVPKTFCCLLFFRWSFLISLLSISSAKETKPLYLYVWRTQKTIQWKFYEDTSSKMIRLYECSKSWPHRHHNFKIPQLSAILKFKRKNEKKPIADDEKTIHCMLLSFHTRIVLFFKCKNITNNNSSWAYFEKHKHYDRNRKIVLVFS